MDDQTIAFHHAGEEAFLYADFSAAECLRLFDIHEIHSLVEFNPNEAFSTRMQTIGGSSEDW